MKDVKQKVVDLFKALSRAMVLVCVGVIALISIISMILIMSNGIW